MFSFISYYWSKLLQRLGFRRMYYFPSSHGMNMYDFDNWEYRPDLPEGSYNAEQCPPKRFKDC